MRAEDSTLKITPKTGVRILFWTPHSVPTKIISSLTKSYFGHTTISVDGYFYDGSWNRKTGWYSEEHLSLEPAAELSVEADIPLDELCRQLPPGKRYPLIRTVSSWAFGYPKYPLSCVGAVKRALLIGGIRCKGRTPYGLYEELKERQLHLARDNERTGPRSGTRA